MLNELKRTVKSILSAPAFVAYRLCPCLPLLHLFRKVNNIQLTASEMAAVLAALKSRPAPRLLIFGLGQDSWFWHTMNSRGSTAFLEDQDDWFINILRRYPTLKAYQVL